MRVIVPLRSEHDVLRARFTGRRKRHAIGQTNLSARLCRYRAQARIVHIETRIRLAPAADALLRRRQRNERRTRCAILIAENLRHLVVEERRESERFQSHVNFWCVRSRRAGGRRSTAPRHHDFNFVCRFANNFHTRLAHQLFHHAPFCRLIIDRHARDAVP